MGERIAKVRRGSGLSRRQLADLIHVESNTISAYENGTRRPSLDVLVLLAKSLHVSTDYILLGDSRSFIDASGLGERELDLLLQIANVLRKG